MFCFSGLTPDEVKHLQKEFHIYMTPDGRIRYICFKLQSKAMPAPPCVCCYSFLLPETGPKKKCYHNITIRMINSFSLLHLTH